MPLSGDRPESDDHLLVHDQHGDQQWQGPQQREAEVLPGLSVGRHPTGIVVGHHDDDARPQDREQGEQARLEAPPAVAVSG